MAVVTREQVMAALFAALTPPTPSMAALKTYSRRLIDPEGLDPAMSPALFLVMHQELYERQESNEPPVRSLKALAFIYNDVGADQNVVPETAVNALLDAIDAALAPTPTSGQQTLGGLVSHVYIEGEIIRASGDVTGKTV